MSSDTPPPAADPRCERGLSDGHVCCLASCGSCGGTGCDKRAGGGEGCCDGAIAAAARSCDAHAAPCVIDRDFRAEAIAHHAAIDEDGVLKVLLIHGAVREAEPRQVRVCAPIDAPSGGEASNVDAQPTEATPTELTEEATPTDTPPPRQHSAAQLLRLTAPSVASKWDDDLRWAGFTWSGSRDGRPSGERRAETLEGEAGAGEGVCCWAFSLAPASAAMLVVRTWASRAGGGGVEAIERNVHAQNA